MLFGWGEGPRALVNPVKAILVGVGLSKKALHQGAWIAEWQSFSIQSCTDPATGFFVGCTALKALLKTLVYVVFTFIICQNTHSTNTTCAFNPWLQVCK